MRTAFRLLACSSAVLMVTTAMARTRPRYGGTLRVEMRETASSYNVVPPVLVGPVYETLTAIDAHGHTQPCLATSWSSSKDGKHWEFAIRPTVTMHDGSPLTPAIVANALSSISNLPWKVRADAERVIIDSETPVNDLPERFSLAKYAIASQDANGNLVGSGPFKLDRHTPDHFTLRANDDYWNGRPYVDTVELTTDRDYRDQANDFSLDRADAVEITPEQLRHAEQDHLWTDVSRPSQTIALVVDSDKPALRDARLRQALSLAIDRAAIQNVILQHQGEVSGSLLPGWLTGYGFLFPSARDISRAQQLRSQLGQLPRLTLLYDAGDASERLIADRVALNARDAGIELQAQPAPAANSDIRLKRVNLFSLSADAALAEIVDQFGIPEDAASAKTDSLYSAEMAAVQTYTVIPLVQLPRIVEMKPAVQNWVSAPNGEWKLDMVWLNPTAREGRP